MPDLTALDFLIISVATWRLSTMFAHEHGPRKVFVHIRDLTRAWGLFDCQRCNSVWMAAFLFATYCTPLYPLVWVFAASGMALLLGSYTGADYQAQGENG